MANWLMMALSTFVFSFSGTPEARCYVSPRVAYPIVVFEYRCTIVPQKSLKTTLQNAKKVTNL